MSSPELPRRYELLAELGRGGGGEVWAVRDRYTGEKCALKTLSLGHGPKELAALVREAVALSGLEGLGLPRVIRFARMPQSGRAYLVRELVEGRSLADALSTLGLTRALTALVRVAEKLTVVHRAGLLHGDIKPANIVLADSGEVMLLDFGLAGAFLDEGVPLQGLTPHYAAPELFEGSPLTVRAEIYSLGAVMRDVLEVSHASVPSPELFAISKRAMTERPEERFPSADEFATALAEALSVALTNRRNVADLLPIVGIEPLVAELLSKHRALKQGEVLRVLAPPSSGRSALLRRAAWSLGIDGHAVALIDETLVERRGAVEAELSDFQASGLSTVTLLVDDCDNLERSNLAALERAREEGARLIVVGGAELKLKAHLYEVPPLAERAARDLVRSAVPSLTAQMVSDVVCKAGGRAGELRRLLSLIDRKGVLSQAELSRLVESQAILAELPKDPLESARYLLDRGRYFDARAALSAAPEGERRVERAIVAARLELGQGNAERALALFEGAEGELSGANSALTATWLIFRARAEIGVGKYQQAIETIARLGPCSVHQEAEAAAYRGIAESFLGKHQAAQETLGEAAKLVENAGAVRERAVVLTSLALVLQRASLPDRAGDAYESAILAAEAAGDAGTLAVLRLNLASLLKKRGELARAIESFEGAVAMGRRSGRSATVRQALSNLVNVDVYLGRIARAKSNIIALKAQLDDLTPEIRAQLLGFEAELQYKLGDAPEAARLYQLARDRYRIMGRSVEAFECELEGIFVEAQGVGADHRVLLERFELAQEELGKPETHRALSCLAEAMIRVGLGEMDEALETLGAAIAAARKASQPEWLWRALELRGDVYKQAGRTLSGRKDHEQALMALEEIATRLPPDLREVYWNDPSRRRVRESCDHAAEPASPQPVQPFPRRTAAGAISTMTLTPLEQRLARILEINAELAGTVDLTQLAGRIVDNAISLLKAERGYLILVDPQGQLVVHTSRLRDAEQADTEFSESIARSVLRQREPIVSLNAASDARFEGYSSVHQLMLKSVACVPVLAPGGDAIGALYLETRTSPGRHFSEELPTLAAFSDQAAVALENARLLSENQRKSDELRRANEALREAKEDLEVALGERTRRLKVTRRRLRDAQATLQSHFGYRRLVGTSDAMRRLYALIERVKDTDLPVLITGESGTGKEVVARVIHDASPRASHKFLGVNCGAIPEHLLESELFGHKRGAFTGADRDRKGLFREAEQGTILLDEVGETPQRMQTGLLRVLQEKKVRAVGAIEEVEVDVRVLFATNRDLESLVEEGRFREDLFYRIHVVELALPSLRKRREDIPQLVDHFLGLFAARFRRDKKTVSREALRILGQSDWPGNVRQLENVLLNAWVLSDGDEIHPSDLDLPKEGLLAPSATVTSAPGSKPSRKDTASQHGRDERERIVEALRACNWNRVRAAELSGIPRRTFYRRLRKYGIL